jgi:multiple sugar transport system substrate-binding protein
LAAHGGAVLTKVADGRSHRSDRHQIKTVVGLDTSAARATLRFMRKLLEVSTPSVLESDGNIGLAEFMAGRAGMGYIWTMRAARLEFEARSKVKGLVKYLPHPNVSGVRCTSPIGGYVLAVPSNLAKERMALAVQAIKWLTSSIADRSAARNGLPVAPFFSVGSDPEMMATTSIVNFVDHLARQGLLTNDIRPALPVYTGIEDVLGSEIHDAMSGRKDNEEALRDAQRRIEALVL